MVFLLCFFGLTSSMCYVCYYVAYKIMKGTEVSFRKNDLWSYWNHIKLCSCHWKHSPRPCWVLLSFCMIVYVCLLSPSSADHIACSIHYTCSFGHTYLAFCWSWIFLWVIIWRWKPEFICCRMIGFLSGFLYSKILTWGMHRVLWSQEKLLVLWVWTALLGEKLPLVWPPCGENACPHSHPTEKHEGNLCHTTAVKLALGRDLLCSDPPVPLTHSFSIVVSSCLKPSSFGFLCLTFLMGKRCLLSFWYGSCLIGWVRRGRWTIRMLSWLMQWREKLCSFGVQSLF